MHMTALVCYVPQTSRTYATGCVFINYNSYVVIVDTYGKDDNSYVVIVNTFGKDDR